MGQGEVNAVQRDNGAAFHSRFDARGFLVRLIYGMKPKVFAVPGIVDAKIWAFPHGMAVANQSLSAAMTTVSLFQGDAAE